MVDVPASNDTAEDGSEGTEPTSLGDVAKAGQDPIVAEDQDVTADPQHIQEES